MQSNNLYHFHTVHFTFSLYIVEETFTGLGSWLPTGPVTGHSHTTGTSRPTLLTVQIFVTPISHKLSPDNTPDMKFCAGIQTLVSWWDECSNVHGILGSEVYHLLPMYKVKTADVRHNTENKHMLIWLTMIFLVHLDPWHVSSSYRVPSHPLAVCTLPFLYHNVSYPSRPSRESASSLCPTWSIKIFKNIQNYTCWNCTITYKGPPKMLLGSE